LAKQSYLEELEAVLLKEGHCLASFGVNSVGWSKSNALRVISHLAETDWAVLGGDVWHKSGDSLELSYDNWCSEPLQEEKKCEFIARSHSEAREYIENYQESGNEDVLYDLVCGRVV